MPPKPKRARFNLRAARRLEKVEKAEADARIAAAKVTEAAAKAEKQRIDAEATAERQRIRAEAQAERDALKVRGVHEAQLLAKGFITRTMREESKEALREEVAESVAEMDAAQNAHSPPEYLTTTRVLPTGHIRQEQILDRNGERMLAVPKQPAAHVTVPGLTPAAKPLPPPPGETRHSMSPQAIAHRAIQAAAGTPMLDGSDPACRFPGIGLLPLSDGQRWSQRNL